MKTYYDILEISRYASKEVLQRAHKVLVKQYHPDLEKDPKKKKEKEEHIKKINEAYEVLSDTNKKKEYDLKVFGPTQTTSTTSTPKSTTTRTTSKDYVDTDLAEELNNERSDDAYADILNQELRKAQERINEEERQIRENLRHYERQYLRGLGYTVREPVNWRRIGITILSVITLLVLIWLIYLIPPIKNKIDETMATDSALGILFKIIKSIYIGIGQVFKLIFNK